jgi:hypothetical protein
MKATAALTFNTWNQGKSRLSNNNHERGAEEEDSTKNEENLLCNDRIKGRRKRCNCLARGHSWFQPNEMELRAKTKQSKLRREKTLTSKRDGPV